MSFYRLARLEMYVRAWILYFPKIKNFWSWATSFSYFRIFVESILTKNRWIFVYISLLSFLVKINQKWQNFFQIPKILYFISNIHFKSHQKIKTHWDTVIWNSSFLMCQNTLRYYQNILLIFELKHYNFKLLYLSEFLFSGEIWNVC